MSNTTLGEAFPVGNFLSEELSARGWSHKEFAEAIDCPAQFVSDLVAGKQELTRETATRISADLGTSPAYWLNLQKQYALYQQSRNKGED